MNTTNEILEACIFLADKNDAKVTVNAVREYRGYGSKSTIGPVVALFNKNREMYQANAAPSGLKLAAASALDKVFIELKEKMTAEIDAVLSSKEEMSTEHNSELYRRSQELSEGIAEQSKLKDMLFHAQDALRLSQDELAKSVQFGLDLKSVNSALEVKLDSLEKSLEKSILGYNSETKRLNHNLNELNVALALSEEKNNHIAKELTEKTDMIKALNLSCRDAAEKLEAKDKANGEALAILNKDLSSADKALASTTSELLFSKNKLAISEDTLQVLVAEIANVKDAESACRDSLQRQKVWFGLVLAKLLRILKKKENSTALAISLVEDSLQAHETLQ
jgi:hypothetical protein